LRRILEAAGTALPVLAALPFVALALLEVVRVVTTAIILVAASLLTPRGLLPGPGGFGGSTSVCLFFRGADWR
jgi:hypothetical protein